MSRELPPCDHDECPPTHCKQSDSFAALDGCEFRLTDRDLPPIARTEANLWKAKYFEAMRELTRANKGIRRLKAKCDRLMKAYNDQAEARLPDSAASATKKGNE